MLDTFSSVGVTRFDLTRIDIDGEKRGFRPQQSMGQLSNFPGAEARRDNIIIRPHSGRAFAFQTSRHCVENSIEGREVPHLGLRHVN